MFCIKCGNKMLEEAKFCSKCGHSANATNSPPSSGQGPSPSTQPQPKTRGKIPYIIAGVAVVLVIILGMALLSSGGDTPPDAPATNIAAGTPTTPAPAATVSTSNETIVMYTISNHYGFAPENIPDFLAFVTGGAEVTNENNTEIFGSAFNVTLFYDGTVQWTEDQLQAYQDLFRDLGFSHGFDEHAGMDVWSRDDLEVGIQLWEGDVIIVITNWSTYDGSWGDGFDGSTFNRVAYLNGIGRTDLLRFPDNHMFGQVFFGQHEVVQVIESRVYIAVDVTLGAASPRTEWIIIDNRGGSGANALVGDRVSVYGIFMGIDTITNMQGRTDRMPNISADLLIFNRAMPNATDLAESIVANLNVHPFAYGRNSQHLGGSRVSLNVAITLNRIRVMQVGPFGVNPADVGPTSDGYGITIEWDLQGRTGADFGLNLPDTSDPVAYRADILVYVTGEIVSIVQNPLDSTLLRVTIRVDNIERA